MHIGENVKRLRDFRGIKQEAIANQLGMTQQNYSLIERSESINDDMLAKIAGIIDFSVNEIKNLDTTPHQTIFNSGNIQDSIFMQNGHVEKIIALYDQLLKSEREKVELLKKMYKID